MTDEQVPLPYHQWLAREFAQANIGAMSGPGLSGRQIDLLADPDAKAALVKALTMHEVDAAGTPQNPVNAV